MLSQVRGFLYEGKTMSQDIYTLSLTANEFATLRLATILAGQVSEAENQPHSAAAYDRLWSKLYEAKIDQDAMPDNMPVDVVHTRRQAE